MSSQPSFDPQPDPTQEEREEAERAVREFMALQAVVAESERTIIGNRKFEDGVGPLYS